MKRYLSILNHRTLFTLILSIVIPFLAFEFEIYYHIDLTLISLAIIFPLVFAIRGAFKRREKSLQFLSQFRSSLKTIYYFFNTNSKLSISKKEEINNILHEISESFVNHLSQSSHNTTDIDKKTENIFKFILDNEEDIPNSSKQKILRFVRDLHLSIENLIAVHTHRTPISLKAYCLIFIYIFPTVYTPTIINKIGFENPHNITYFIIILSEFILISLYNIQDQMEHPFDRDGLDDIKLDNFKIDRIVE